MQGNGLRLGGKIEIFTFKKSFLYFVDDYKRNNAVRRTKNVICSDAQAESCPGLPF